MPSIVWHASFMKYGPRLEFKPNKCAKAYLHLMQEQSICKDSLPFFQQLKPRSPHKARCLSRTIPQEKEKQNADLRFIQLAIQ